MIYELKAGGVDERRLVGAKLEKLAEGETGITLFPQLKLHYCFTKRTKYWNVFGVVEPKGKPTEAIRGGRY